MSVYLRIPARGPVSAKSLRKTVQELLAALGEHESSVSISFVGDDEIQVLNRDYRGKDQPTDVLSFPLLDDAGPHTGDGGDVERLLGDIVISTETAARQAAEYDAPVQREVERLLIHGLLHLLGHDHEEAAERALMETQERRLAAVIGMPWPYLESR